MSRADEIRARLDAAGREYRADDGREAHRRDAITHAPTDLAWLLDRADELAAALERIRDMEPEPPDELPEHPDCDECARRRKRGWPPSGLCEERYRQVSAQERQAGRLHDSQQYRMRSLADAALARYRGDE